MMAGETVKSAAAMRLGRKVEELRKALGLSQEQLAKKAGTTKGQISRIENGLSEPPMKRLRRLAKALGVTPGVLADA